MSHLLECASSPNLVYTTQNDRNVRNSSRSNRQPIQKLQELKSIVEKAIENHKTFTILGPFACIKTTLKFRGWIEKFNNKTRYDETKNDKFISQDLNGIITDQEDEFSKNNNITNALYEIQMSRLLRDYSVDFIWTMKNEPIKWKNLCSKTLISRFPRAEFTTKAGLCTSLQQVHWFQEENVSIVLFPRCYNIYNDEELTIFIENFRITACISVIKYICENSNNRNTVFDQNGTIPITSIEFAFRRCYEYIFQKQHKDIDIKENEKVWDHQWDQFLTYYYQIVHNSFMFNCNEESEISEIIKRCENILKELAEHWPQLHLDGVNNLWILKPAAKSRGRGIIIMKKIEDILLKINSLHSKECRYVAQKYIERPLLIYETKFDIRQWFLVTNAFPLTIWMYKESYLRFCSQIFSLVNTHESIHLSNNAVQCKYTNGKRDQNLPDENMWDCYTFQTYLRAKGQPEVWESIIYSGMRQSIICTLLASQDTMDTRKNCFELFGADFMLSEDFEPWLIEINSGPSMSCSTSVTARMCAQVLDDVIKVVIDRKYNKNADTGMFELVYKQNIPPAQPYMGQNLIVRGIKIENSMKINIDMKKKLKLKACNSSQKTPNGKKYLNRNVFTENLSQQTNVKQITKYYRKKTTEDKLFCSVKNKENVRNSRLNLWKRANHKTIDQVKIKNLTSEFNRKNVKSDHQFPFVNEGLKKKLSSPTSNSRRNTRGNTFPKLIKKTKPADNCINQTQ